MPLIARALCASALIAWSVSTAGVAVAAPTKQECVDSSERGQALRQAGSLRVAREEFVTCISASCPDPVIQDCAARLSEIDQALLGADAHADAHPLGERGVAGIVLAGLGALGVAVGGILGIVAKSTYDAALTDHCGGMATTCNAAGTSEVRAAHAQAAAATGGVIGGAALLVGGVVLWATDRTTVRVAPTAGGATFGIGGTF